jgi:hypothetical protein
LTEESNEMICVKTQVVWKNKTETNFKSISVSRSLVVRMEECRLGRRGFRTCFMPKKVLGPEREVGCWQELPCVNLFFGTGETLQIQFPLQKSILARHRWLRPVILATWEA